MWFVRFRFPYLLAVKIQGATVHSPADAIYPKNRPVSFFLSQWTCHVMNWMFFCGHHIPRKTYWRPPLPFPDFSCFLQSGILSLLPMFYRWRAARVRWYFLLYSIKRLPGLRRSCCFYYGSYSTRLHWCGWNHTQIPALYFLLRFVSWLWAGRPCKDWKTGWLCLLLYSGHSLRTFSMRGHWWNVKYRLCHTSLCLSAGGHIHFLQTEIAHVSILLFLVRKLSGCLHWKEFPFRSF